MDSQAIESMVDQMMTLIFLLCGIYCVALFFLRGNEKETQYSFTDDQTKLGAPRDFTITVRNVKVSAGAGFLVALTGEIMTMPGLPKVPAAERIDVDETGKISGLF